MKAMKKGFTIVEILIVLSVIILVAIALLVLLNPKKQIEKSWDGKRKGELSTLKKTLEDYYNDKKCYPKPTEVCYKDYEGLNCPICGKQTPDALLSYVSELPCDPQDPNKDYLYQVDNSSCPNWFRIYSKLSNLNDVIIEEVGCKYGCGPAPLYAYSYGVSSPNVGLEKSAGPSPTPTITPSPTPIACPADPVSKYCIQVGGILQNPNCTDCGTFYYCSRGCNTEQLYSDEDCSIPCYKE